MIDCGLFEGLKSQDWYINGELEPDAPWNGKSVLTQWLNEVEKDGITQLKCCVPLVDRADEWCPSPKVFSRLDRALAHVRNHLGHKPFVCEGLPNCKQEVWYVRELLTHLLAKILLSFTSTARFPSAEYLHAHWLGPKYLLCEGW